MDRQGRRQLRLVHQRRCSTSLSSTDGRKLREEMRADLLSSFDAATEPTVRKTFELLLSTAGPEVLGFSKMPDGFMTMQYQ